MTMTLEPPAIPDALIGDDPLTQHELVGTDRAPQRRRITDWRPHRPSTHGWITGAIGAFTLVLYSWNLSAVGMGNSYYAAAVKSMTVSWKAFFFGALDPGSFITVDKPPAALWLQAISGRIFGFSTTSMILPEVLCGVGSVLLLHKLVRRWQGDVAAHLAAIALAVTPIAVAMFRSNNPDAVLTLLGVAGAWAMWNAIETGRTRWLVAAGAITGLAFNAKMLQAFLVVPAFAIVYLVAGPPKLGKRFVQLLAAMAALVVSCGWWMAIVAMFPASARPYIGSTSDNSIVSLLLGYNGLDRVFGSGSGTGGGGAAFGGTAGLWRMFNSETGGLVSWLIPIAAVGLIAGLLITRRRPRDDRARAGWLLWGGWALTCMEVFSLSEGIFHPYYTVQLAPAVAALAGAGGVALFRLARDGSGRSQLAARMALPATIVLGAAWAVALLQRTPNYHSELRTLIVAGAAISAAGLTAGFVLRHRVLQLAAAAIGALTLLAGPTAYAVTTVESPVSGSLISAGPTVASTGFGGLGGPGGGRGGPGSSTSVSSELIDYLETNQGDATYLVAAFGSSATEPIILATGEPVITIGGFSGSDPAPTLAQFQQLVASGQVRFLLASSGQGGGPNGGRGGSSEITQWAEANGTAVTVGGATLYDLSGVTS